MLTGPFVFPETLSNKIISTANAAAVAVQALLVTGVQCVLHRYAEEAGAVIGLCDVVPDRKEADGEVVLIKARMDSGDSFRTHLHRIDGELQQAMAHRDIPFQKMVGPLSCEYDSHGHPLIPTLVSMYDGSSGDEPSSVRSEFELRFIQTGESFALHIAYSPDLYEAVYVKQIAGHVLTCLTGAMAQPDAPISSIRILSLIEKKTLSVDLASGPKPVSSDSSATLHQWFERQAARTPERTAIISGSDRLTYGELNARANRLAHSLRAKGVRPDQLVCVMADRSSEMMVGLLAILKAGGAYVPIDPGYPQERIRYILNDSKASLLLTQTAWLDSARFGFQGDIIDLNDPHAYGESTFNPDPAAGAAHAAYVIYTSGSTGTPKGVVVEHHAVVDFLHSVNHRYLLGSDDVVLFKGPFVFDGTVYDLWWWMTQGATVCLAAPGEEKDPGRLVELIREHGVTTCIFVPALLHVFLDYVERMDAVNQLASLRYVTVGGETLSPPLAERFRVTLLAANGTRLANAYGPTETTVDCVCCMLPEDRTPIIVPIGRPTSYSRVYVLQPGTDSLQPIGVPGEICVAGTGVAREYLNRPQLTAEKFVADPFVAGARMFRTGDWGRWLPDGTLECLGRIDQQVKIRGYRIELEEIESKLQESGAVKQTVAAAQDDGAGAKQLVAYFTADRPVSVRELRELLALTLPEYMIPSLFVPVDRFPLTSSGKVDRKALLALGEAAQNEALPAVDNAAAVEAAASDSAASNSVGIGTAAVPADPEDSLADVLPTYNEVEQKLIGIWREVLRSEDFGLQDHFLEIGGHSLKVMNVMMKINEAFRTNIPLKMIYDALTIEKMAQVILRVTAEGLSDRGRIQPATQQESYPLSSAQKRLYILHQLGSDQTSYNVSGGLHLLGAVDPARLAAVFQTLVNRHESLRTTFDLNGEVPVQHIHKRVPFRLHRMSAAEGELDGMAEAFVRPFDMTQAPLLRAALIQVKPELHVLLIDMHHIISDGVSMETLQREFMDIYEGRTLAPLRIQYKDYAVWQQQQDVSGAMLRQKTHWLRQFAEPAPVLALPTDYARPDVREVKGAHHHGSIGEAQTARLHQLAASSGTTLFMVLLAAFQVLLGKYSGQSDIVVGSPIAGRTHEDVQPVVGMFVNTLALRGYPSGKKPFNGFLREIKEICLQAYEYQEYPFEELIEALGLQRDMSRHPLFDVMLVLQNTEQDEAATERVAFAPYTVKNNTSKFDLTLNVSEENGRLEYIWEYATSLFKKETILRLERHFTRVLDIAANRQDIAIADIALLTEEEERRIRHEFNPQTIAAQPEFGTIHELFEAQARKHPERIALTWDSGEMTYRTLNERANRLARTLRRKGVGADSNVGLLLERSPDMLVAVLAVLKAGGAYVPIDPSYPADRIGYIAENSRLVLMLTPSEEASRGLQPELAAVPDWLEMNSPENDEADASDLPPVSGAADAAYLIYTSGTTGRPKGVVIEHANVVHLFCNETAHFDFSERDVWTLFHSYCFDFSVWEMYGALLYGGRLVIVPKLSAQDPRAFAELLRRERVTVLNQTPSAFYRLAEATAALPGACDSLRYVVFGGEALLPARLQAWHRANPQAKLINMYGITEITVHATWHEVTAEEMASGASVIGQALPTSSIFVADPAGHLTPPGVTGEMYVGGLGVARGYWEQPVLTEERFVRRPFAPGQRLYRTGDLARWRDDGRLEYLGRIDHQVKIRGYRIEIGEIETALLSLGPIREACVIAKRNSDGDDYLCAYYVTGEELGAGELRRLLVQRLPDYMAPSYFIRLAMLPLNANGKIDRPALPDPADYAADQITGEAFMLPRSETEWRLAEVWSEVLGVKEVGIRDDFFVLGGDSFKAVKIVSRLSGAITLAELFRFKTIEALALRLDAPRGEAPECWQPLFEAETAAGTILCVPYGGGSSMAYRGLAERMAQSGGEWSVLALEWPRAAEAVQPSVEQIAEACLRQLPDSVRTKPLLVYGHCAGSAVALELARWLELEGTPAESVWLGGALNEGGGEAPEDGPSAQEAAEQVIAGASDEQIFQFMKDIHFQFDLNQGEAALLIRQFRQDSERCNVYFEQGPRFQLNTALYCVIGDADPLTEGYASRYAGWSSYAKQVELRVIAEGGHYFLETHAQELAGLLTEASAGAVGAANVLK